MKIISCNVNGIRSACKKGFVDFINNEKPDIFCFQEIKAGEENFPAELLNLSNYYLFINPAGKKGYSGVAILTKEKPISVNKKIGLERFDKEGRLLELEFPGFTILNFYFPHGGRLKENFDYKLEAYKKLFSKLKRLKKEKVILIGDFNIAHSEIDLARPSQNKNNIMFTPEEREQIDNLLGLGFVDSFRKKNMKSGNYTWWPYAFNAKERNLGWRIDYAFVSKKLSKKIKRARIYPNVNFSDHCPIGLELF
jgi:exodeoxyribonuclease-3